MELICYAKGDDGGFVIRAGTAPRDWMDAAHHRAPYRCLPLVMSRVEGSQARKLGGRKHYPQGVDLQGNEKPFLHRTERTLHPFELMK